MKPTIFFLILLVSISAGLELWLYNLENTATGYAFFNRALEEQRAKDKAAEACPNYTRTGTITSAFSTTITYECNK